MVNTLKKLDYGQSPFDHLSREELLLQCQRMYSATLSLVDVARNHRHGQEQSIYWTIGRGAKALEKGNQALAAAEQDFSDESIYYSFFRYANDLLFVDKADLRVRPGLVLCNTCSCYVGLSDSEPSPVGGKCSDFIPPNKCDGILRNFEWSDLRPESPDHQGA